MQQGMELVSEPTVLSDQVGPPFVEDPQDIRVPVLSQAANGDRGEA